MKAVLFPNLKAVFLHAFTTFEVLLNAGGYRNLGLVLLSVVVFWHVYTPVHELLHVGACLLGGGTVEELALKPQYGGSILQHVFPFVTPESDYGGQLTGFTTPNDAVYALVDFAPYTLSLFGLSLIEWARLHKSAVAFGVGVVLAFVPVMSISGDYYEGVSLLTSQIAFVLDPALGPHALVSDDVFKLAGEMSEKNGWSGVTVLGFVSGLVGAVYLVVLTLGLQVLTARRLFGRSILKPSEPEIAVSES